MTQSKFSEEDYKTLELQAEHQILKIAELEKELKNEKNERYEMQSGYYKYKTAYEMLVKEITK